AGGRACRAGVDRRAAGCVRRCGMSAYTPGPWFHDGNGNVWRRDPKDLYQNGGTVAGDKPLATIHKGWHHDGAEGYPVEANARLIAAAPELLEALIDCRRVLEL